METVTSPDGELELALDCSRPDAALSVRRAGEEVIEPSPIGLHTPDGPFPAAYGLVGVERDAIDDTRPALHGKRATLDHRATTATLHFEGSGGRSVAVETRVADDGVAYRYRVDGDGAVLLHGGAGDSPGEESGVRLPRSATAWLHGYERNHESVGRTYGAREAAGDFSLPGLFRVGHGAGDGTHGASPAGSPAESYALVCEAGVDGTYAAARLATAADDGLYALRHPDTSISFSLPGTTPWRVAVVGDLATVVESTLVPELVDGPRPDPSGDAGVTRDPVADWDWVDPGRVAWSWWGDTASPADPDAQRRYVDYAAERGWEYVLVDEGWDADWLPDVVAYAAERDVGVFVWAHWTALRRADDRARRLDRWADWGVAGVKVDFMDGDDQGRLGFYDDLLADAAARQLLVNVHGSVVPTGLSTRWPHLLTYEGVLGAEHRQWGGYPASHDAILPFTRNAVGSMDYTPVTFSADGRATTAGHELATAVVFESGLQHYADRIEAYAARPAAEWVLERVPAAWDETVFLGGRPGAEATLARRTGDDWVVGSITAGPARSVSVPLDVLDSAREATVVRETGENGESLVRERRTVEPDDRLDVAVAPNGGFVAYLPGGG